MKADAKLAAEIAQELADTRDLLHQEREHHDALNHSDSLAWSENCDVVLPIPATAKIPLRIRQVQPCSYCHVGANLGPGGAVWAAGIVLASFVANGGQGDEIESAFST